MISNKFYFFAVFISFLLNQSCASDNTGPKVLPGAYQTKGYMDLLNDKNVALVANHTSLLNNLHLLDTLIALGVNVHTVFSPEHGFRGQKGAGVIVGDSTNKQDSGIRFKSLYGNNYKPMPTDLNDIDIVVFDLQDVGTRFFTYISTLHYVMEACAENYVPLLVLDRPNPNAHYIDGPVLDEKYKSFVGMHPVPAVYGMTIGEYAKMINGENWLANGIQCNITVVPCLNYTHQLFYEPPVSPSPNLPDIETIYLYPSHCFFEGTVMSEGRGTANPFRVIGHPGYPDTLFYFTPKSIPGKSLHPKFENQKCYGIDFTHIVADSLIKHPGIDLRPLIQCYNKMGLGNAFFTEYFSLLAGNNNLQKAIVDGKSYREIKKSWQAGIEQFKLTREKYLIYPD